MIDFSGVPDPALAAKITLETGRLQVFDFEPSLAPPSVTRNQRPAPVPSLYSLLTAVQKEAKASSPASYYLFKTTPSHPVL